eukprot:CAMPEP_0197659036 /NCGR_PEP_ID=MMETSP1338-20131121/45925_1 /TAXON_ID=43686 ORGANISM="Pelagodinium beii, Strain RCC1491" /NCGR_SAMPLE_ID=MMETSP1338 /ASSEMBLY_ACC=CAM_ASM_000754 /LENGTH=314 /DNA_ID=CAMNT_0043235777 /DNA_START=208 /DNA_END=1152 /DNA_ORIENTATION=+
MSVGQRPLQGASGARRSVGEILQPLERRPSKDNSAAQLPIRKGSKEKEGAAAGEVAAAPELSEEEQKKKAAKEADEALSMRAMNLAKRHRLEFLEVKVMLRSLEAHNVKTGGLTFSFPDFQKFLCGVFDVHKVPDDVAMQLHRSTCKDGKGELKDFAVDEFLDWYMMNMFTLVAKLRGDAKQVASIELTQELCDKHGLKPADLDKVKKQFDKFDEDGSGEIEQDEFQAMIYNLVQAKPGDISDDRIKSFWREIDRDGSGSVDFAEFVEWYLKYFGDNSSGPTESFYASFAPQKQRQTALINAAIADAESMMTAA